MEDSAIISILEELKTSSSSRIANNLIKIRQQVIVTDNGIKKFKANGGISLMISLLHKPNEKISDLVLSILGNCCMKQDVVLEVEKLNGLRYVIHIIKNIAKDSILCRACRVVGNVAQFENTVDNVHEYGAVGAICGLLNSTDKSTVLTPSTKLMAVRALRLLWTTQRRQHEMLAQNVPKSIVMILIQHKSKWSTSPQDKDLLLGILRCLLHFTENPSPELVLQMSADGSGFQSIVSLIPLNPYFTMKCITNLSTVATTRSVLETNEAARILIERLNAFRETDPCSTWPIEDLNALCLLCRHAATREEVRTRNGLPLLLSVVKSSTNKKQQGQVLHALLHFIYDEVSLKILISDGLVKVLVTCLTQFLDLMKCQHNIIEKKHSNTIHHVQDESASAFSSYVCRKLLKFKNNGSGTSIHNHLKRSYELCDNVDDMMMDQLLNKRMRTSLAMDTNELIMDNNEIKSKIKLKKKFTSNTDDIISSSQVTEKPCGSKINFDDSFDETTNRLNLKHKQQQQQRYEDTLSPIPFDTRLSPQPSTCYSPNCTPPRSVITDFDDESNSDDSIRYSPVCSDTEESDDDKTNWENNIINFENDDFVHYEMGDNELENALEEEMEPKTGETRTITWLLVLLSRVSYMDDLDPTFGNFDTVQVLLRYMELSRQPITRAASILLRIASQGDFFINLLNNKLILILHNLLRNPPHGTTCKQCVEIKNFINYNVLEKLTRVAESGYVKGQIAHALLRGESDKQQKLVISIPYLVQSRSLIRSLFDHCRGLQILLLAVSNMKIDDWWPYAVNALGFLAIGLNIKDPKKSDDLQLSVNDIDCITTKIIPSNNDKTITFELDDQSHVHANRDLLIEQSDFFKVLLTGEFMESHQSVVRLCDVTANGFQYLLILLKYYQDKQLSNNDNDSFPLCINLSVSFEVLILADRFLIDDVTDTLSRAILKYRMCSCNVAEMYRYSLESHTNYLRVECIAYGLVGLTEKSRVMVFRNIINAGYGEYLIEDCRILLDRYLNINRYVKSDI